jgi:hypothetical protein
MIGESLSNAFIQSPLIPVALKRSWISKIVMVISLLTSDLLAEISPIPAG